MVHRGIVRGFELHSNQQSRKENVQVFAPTTCSYSTYSKFRISSPGWPLMLLIAFRDWCAAASTAKSASGAPLPVIAGIPTVEGAEPVVTLERAALFTFGGAKPSIKGGEEQQKAHSLERGSGIHQQRACVSLPGGAAILSNDGDGLEDAGLAPAPSYSRPVTKGGAGLLGWKVSRTLLAQDTSAVFSRPPSRLAHHLLATTILSPPFPSLPLSALGGPRFLLLQVAGASPMRIVRVANPRAIARGSSSRTKRQSVPRGYGYTRYPYHTRGRVGVGYRSAHPNPTRAIHYVVINRVVIHKGSAPVRLPRRRIHGSTRVEGRGGNGHHGLGGWDKNHTRLSLVVSARDKKLYGGSNTPSDDEGALKGAVQIRRGDPERLSCRSKNGRVAVEENGGMVEGGIIVHWRVHVPPRTDRADTSSTTTALPKWYSNWHRLCENGPCILVSFVKRLIVGRGNHTRDGRNVHVCSPGAGGKVVALEGYLALVKMYVVSWHRLTEYISPRNAAPLAKHVSRASRIAAQIFYVIQRFVQNRRRSAV
ncbi:hypothetical protein BDZ89DRAFT_1047814 [Hymenopellis radicata]|nr:hypothetical protein BDZ89DRAFT_1047814 [Hymenopellis radicata]